jgi:SAM-dependent methyltransferase
LPAWQISLAFRRRLGKVDAMTHKPQPGQSTVEFWDSLYERSGRIWSGNVNARLAEIAEGLTPGRALDLGCGEGGDAMWLAEHGWTVVAADVSPVALARARVDAEARGVVDRIDFRRTDLTASVPDGPFDLVSAHFLHAPDDVDFDRGAVLRSAAVAVAPGGTLLIVDHGSAPSWSEHHAHEFPSAAETLDGLALDPQDWRTLRVEAVEREVSGPDGRAAAIADNVMLLQRHAAG